MGFPSFPSPYLDPICPNGAQVRPGAPSTFVFEEAWILSALGLTGNIPLGFAGFALLALFGLPSDPQNTAAFVASDISADQPTAEDWVKLAFPPIALVTGSYTRIGNWLRLQKWLELAECKPVDQVDPHDSGPLGNQCVTNYGLTDNRVGWVTGPIDADVLEVRFTPQHALTLAFDNTTVWWATGPLPIGTLKFDGTWAAASPVSGGQIGSDGPTAICGGPPAGHPWLIYIASWNAEPGAIECFDFALRGHAPPEEPVPPPKTVRPGCPPTPDLEAVGDFLCQLKDQLDRIEAKIDWLAANTSPPPTEPADDPVPIDDPTIPVPKPTDAIGAVVIVNAPMSIARYGVNPGVQFMAGHVSIGTQDGWLPSVQLKHARQLVWPLPPHSTALGLDLAPGVSASISWLKAPK